MYFTSDNCAGAHPLIAASLAEHASGFVPAYGESDFDRAVERRFSEIFEHEVSVFFVATGTASNSLALTSVAKPGGVVFAHSVAHIIEDECGAPEYLSGQLRIAPVDGADGKMEAAHLSRLIKRMGNDNVHGGRPSAISVTQATESGTIYSLAELDAISEVSRSFGLPLHMDGARFTNALVSLGCTPAEMTWKRGIDILSFGATKNGCWCAEAVIFFSKDKAADFPWIRKRAAQLFSKSRFIAAQFDAYFRDDLWLNLARHSNAMASKLAAALDASSSVRLVGYPRGNEVFAVLKKQSINKAKEAGATFYEWPVPPHLVVTDDEDLCRFVTSFATTDEHVSSFMALL
ncbi:threonine aldolase [Thozetella sp. PMI_491]|nr:threonine aldolase [Thozetella sp. PMI_491]